MTGKVTPVTTINTAKTVLTVTGLARKSDTTPHVVRYYTKLGLLQPVRDPDNGYRLYSSTCIARLHFIMQAKSLGFTLNEILEITQEADQGQSPCPRVREILQKRIKENRRQLEELMALQERMEQALEQWSALPDGEPDGDSVCHLIEGFNNCQQPF